VDESELETDPRRRKPTLSWLLLGLAVVVLFAALAFLLFDHGPPRVFAPPPGVPR